MQDLLEGTALPDVVEDQQELPEYIPDPSEENSTYDADTINEILVTPPVEIEIPQTNIVMPDYVKAQIGTLEWFTNEIQKPMQGFDTGWAGLNNALNKLQAGFHCIGGDSNVGKTSWMSMLEWNIYRNNLDAYVLSFSLDDSLRDKLCRTIAAANKVQINAVRNPNAYKDAYPTLHTRVFHGIEMLKQAAWRYRAVDATTWGTDVEDLADEIRGMVIRLKSLDNPLRLVVFLDNFHDLSTQNTMVMNNDKMRYDYIAQYISDLASELDIPIVCTVEFRKLNNFKRPTVDDIRESVKIKYEAKSILLCHNEVGLKGEAAAVYWEKKGEVAKQPVFEVKVGKNKYNSFKGRMFFEMYPDMAYFEEATGQRASIYAQAVYQTDN